MTNVRAQVPADAPSPPDGDEQFYSPDDSDEGNPVTEYTDEVTENEAGGGGTNWWFIFFGYIVYKIMSGGFTN